ncbi:MAG TPA: outer membrane beta-barrel protein [Bacteroidota bacterium]|nr:outer membrane beta-barrel protein [Bacteroidota bacterium]
MPASRLYRMITSARTKLQFLCLITLVVLVPLHVFSQAANLKGRILDSRKELPLAGAHVKLTNTADSSQVFVTTTDGEGAFAFSGIGFGLYAFEATYVGHTAVDRIIRVDRSSMALADVLLSEVPIQLGEVVVQGSPPPAIQKTDTTEFNAGAFKTNPDAEAEDLVAKLPGVVITNGTVVAQGENVQQVLVDGKPFFGSDPTLALRNLPADAIEKIQIFDKMSDQAEFTGFDDGQSVKTLNIITRRDRRIQNFGKVYGGYGDDDHYLAGGSTNYFKDNTRLSLIGLSNDVNQQNFSTQDILGVIGGTNQRSGFMGGGGGGGRRGRQTGVTPGGGGPGNFTGGGPGGGSGNPANFLVGQQNGLITTTSVGANYADDWGSHVTVSQSYFFNLTSGNNDERLHRQYFSTTDTSSFYDENTASKTQNSNHRYDMRLEYTADSSNSIIELPRLYFQDNHSTTGTIGTNTQSPQQLLNQTDNNNSANTQGNNLTNHIVLRHKFDDPGRTISLDIGTSANQKRGTTLQQSTTEYVQASGVANDTLNQQTPVNTDGYTISSRLAYTEPVGGFSQFQLTYNPSYTKNSSNNKKYDFDPVTGEYIIPEPSLSNVYDNEYTTENGGLGYRIRFGGLNAMAGVSYQVADLRGQQQFPYSSDVDRTFANILPNAFVNYLMADHKNLRVIYRSSTQAPAITQLQNIINNTNPLILTTGNPNLSQSLSQTVATRYSYTDVANGRSLFLFFTVAHTGNYIANSTITATRDTVLQGGIAMNSGTQLTYPVNLNDRWVENSFLTYSLVATPLKSNLTFNSGLGFSQTPGLIDDNLNVAKNFTITGGSVLSSNISQDVDYTVSYSGNYVVSRNTFEPDLNTNYYYHTAEVKLNLIFWEGVVFRNDISNVLYSGLSGDFNKNTLLWNINLGKKFLSKDRGELTFVAVDLLNQNKSVSRTVTDSYVEDDQNNVLGRYFMLSFTYTVR